MIRSGGTVNIIVASVISALLGDYIEAGAIMAIVILNAALGLWQEMRTEQAVAALKDMTSPHALVIRNGRAVEIQSSELVVGDVLALEEGDAVSADCRVVDSAGLDVADAGQAVGADLRLTYAAGTAADRRAQEGDAAGFERALQPQVAHHRADHRSVQGASLQRVHGQQVDQLIAVHQRAGLIHHDHTVAVAVNGPVERHGRYDTAARRVVRGADCDDAARAADGEA